MRACGARRAVSRSSTQHADLQPIARINLTEHDLGDAEVYDALRDLVLDVAENPAPK